ncbi:hypothetical protein L226DRAFT_535092 [Lentinus tigrinus ALCF2SS1-7]|uniref:Uncharacterized protein n=1 Tax=Lentinus tigrinus ALCF2SS1-6 TaxID=1328759 RepID=A0A5C2S8L0_9APHY|nr:hypothetical protein L227DRAFT_575694 [Lentinus tigrinus ALCF2SS1-6]RPD74877.1 hypothetical protein L226DRAFT_535092 [Lentinus tigrinus ALCF2SS1-7]
MATKVPTRARKAERNNESLFPIFLKHLASDNVKDFTTTAVKLANWLGVDKAYYQNARPVIIEMLETAHENVRRRYSLVHPSHVTQVNPDLQAWLQPYLALVQTVVPFYRLFTEGELQLRLRALVKNSETFALLPQQPGFPPASISAPSPFASASLAHSPVTPSPFAPSSLSTPSPAPDVSGKADIQPPNSDMSVMQSSPSGPVSAPTAALVNATMSSQPPKPTKAKKRKLVVDDDDYIQADLNWYKDNQSIKPGPPPEVPDQPQSVEVTPGPMVPPPEAEPTALALAQPSPVTPPDTPLTDRPPSQKRPRSRSPSVSLEQIVHVQSRASSSTPREPKESSPPKEKSVDAPDAPSTSRSPLSSPTILPPSIQRRRSPERHLVTTSIKTEALPSPFANKKAFVKGKKGKRKGPPGLKVLPIPPDRSQSASGVAEHDSNPRVAANPGMQANSEDARSATTSECPSASPAVAATSLPPHPSSPPSAAASLPPRTPLASTSHPSEGPDVSADPVEGPPASVDQRHTLDATEESIAEAASQLVSVVLHDTTEIAFSPEPMDLGSDEPGPPSAPDRTAQDLQPSEQEDEPGGDVQSQSAAVNRADDRVEEESRPSGPMGQHDGDVEMREPSSQPDEVPTEAIASAEDASERGGAEEAASSTLVRGSASSELNDHLDGSHVASPEKQQEAMAPSESESPFMYKYIRLLNLTRGHLSHTPADAPVELAFELTAEEVAQIARWKNRDTVTGDLSESICISLVCYSNTQCTALFAHTTDESAPSPADVVKCGHPIDWPVDGSLFAVLDAANTHPPSRGFTLSPPFSQCKPDRSVDLGARDVRPGINTLRLFQYRDHSDLVFAVILHHPTTAQLAEVQRVRDQDRLWHQFLDGLGTFTLPAPTLVPSPLPKVNAVSCS